MPDPFPHALSHTKGSKHGVVGRCWGLEAWAAGPHCQQGTPNMFHTVSVAKSAPETLILAPQDPAGFSCRWVEKILPALVRFEPCQTPSQALLPSHPVCFNCSALEAMHNQTTKNEEMALGYQIQGFPGRPAGFPCWPRLAGSSSVLPGREARKRSLWVST